jgi:heterodisulfide reductase subunit B
MKYALFVGCTTLARLNAYDASTRRVSEALGLELVDMEGAGCCGTPIMDSIQRKTASAMAAWNMCIAEDMDLDVMTLCNGCNEVLAKANIELKENKEIKEEINKVLAAVGREFRGSVDVKHLIRVLYEDIGVKRIREAVKNPLKGLKAAVHYGCHMLRPSEVLRFDNPEVPRSMDELVNATGAVSVDFLDKMTCCGAPILAVNEDLALGMAREKVRIMSRRADVIVTACPFCFLQFVNAQLLSEEAPEIPVVHYPQLLGLAMGLDYDELALQENRIDASRLLEFLGNNRGEKCE